MAKYQHNVKWTPQETVERNAVKATILTRVREGELQFSLTIRQALSGGRTGGYLQFRPGKTGELISEITDICEDLVEDILEDFKDVRESYKNSGFTEPPDEEDFQPRRPRRQAEA